MSAKIWEEDEDMRAFYKMEKELLEEHHGKIAVFCEGKLIAIGATIKDALAKARKASKRNDFFLRELYTAEEQASTIL